MWWGDSYPGFAELTEFLLKRSANPLAKNKKGQLPLDLAKADNVRDLLRAAQNAAEEKKAVTKAAQEIGPQIGPQIGPAMPPLAAVTDEPSDAKGTLKRGLRKRSEESDGAEGQGEEQGEGELHQTGKRKKNAKNPAVTLHFDTGEEENEEAL
jgi:hypothetical protein